MPPSCSSLGKQGAARQVQFFSIVIVLGLAAPDFAWLKSASIPALPLASIPSQPVSFYSESVANGQGVKHFLGVLHTL